MDNIEKRLHEQIRLLVGQVKCHFKDFVYRGSIESRMVRGYRTTVSIDERTSLYQTQYSPFEEIRYEVAGITKFGDELSKCSGYSECVDLIKELFIKYLNETHFEYASGHLYQFIADIAVTKNQELTIDQSIDNFIDQLKNAAVDYKIKIYLYGIRLKGTIKIGDVRDFLDITFREPVFADFEKEIVSDLSYPLYNPYDRATPENTTCILEFILHRNKNNMNFLGIDDEKERFIDVLRLYKLGRVTELKFMAYDRITSNLAYGPGYPQVKIYKTLEYEIFPDDSIKLSEFINTMIPLMPIDIRHNRSKEISHLDVSFKWYKDALLYESDDVLRSEMIVLAITSAITSLSALFTNSTKNPRGYLIRRMDSFFKLYNFDNSKLIKNIGMAYEMRSYVSHGSKIALSQDHVRYLKSLNITDLDYYNKILDYNRVCLIIFMELNEIFEKEEILAILDKCSMLELVNNRQTEKQIIEILKEISPCSEINLSEHTAQLSYFM